MPTLRSAALVLGVLPLLVVALVPLASSATLVRADAGSASAPSVGGPFYTVTFTESGLPSHLLKGSDVNIYFGQYYESGFSGQSSVQVVAVRAASYPLLITGPPGYVAEGVPGATLDVSGNLTYNIEFVPGATASVFWSATGLGWDQTLCLEVSVWGSPYCSAIFEGALLNVPTGTYGYDLLSPTGPQMSVTAKIGGATVPTDGTLTLTAGQVTTIDFAFAFPYSITFSEVGLPSGTVWTVELVGHSLLSQSIGPRGGDGLIREAVKVTESSDTSTITFTLQNGTYHFHVELVTGFARELLHPHYVKVVGGDVSVVATFHARRA